MPNYGRTAYYIDVDAIRNLVRDEVSVRGVSYTEIQEQTGILSVGLGRFLNPRTQLSLHHDALVTLVKWAGSDVARFVKRRKSMARHTDTFEQRQLRNGQAFIKNLGVQTDQSETSVDVLMRLVAEAKEKGFLA